MHKNTDTEQFKTYILDNNVWESNILNDKNNCVVRIIFKIWCANEIKTLSLKDKILMKCYYMKNIN